MHPCAYLLENIPPLGDSKSIILARWQHIKVWIGEPMQVDAFNLGCWGCSIIPTQGTCDYKNMGP